MSEKVHLQILNFLHELADSLNQSRSCWECGQVDSVWRAVGLAGCVAIHVEWLVEAENARGLDNLKTR
jgi:hypothetical protein